MALTGGLYSNGRIGICFLLLMVVSLVASDLNVNLRSQNLNSIIKRSTSAAHNSDEDSGSEISANKLEYLGKFGYATPKETTDELNSTTSTMKQTSIEQAIKSYQWFMGLKQTGSIDEETRSMMDKSRCGVKDVGNEAGNYRSKWDKQRLTYKLMNYPSKFNSNESERRAVEIEIAKAFRLWSMAANLNFAQRKEGKPDIEISFVRGNHSSADGTSDCDHMAGPIAGHAFFPSVGQIHFDDTENWLLDNKQADDDKGLILSQMATHQIGHALGLSHNNERNSVMHPVLETRQHFKLHSVDRRAIRGLYGRRERKMVEPKTLAADELAEKEEDEQVDKSKSPKKMLPNDEPVELISTESLEMDGDNDLGEGNSGDTSQGHAPGSGSNHNQGFGYGFGQNYGGPGSGESSMGGRQPPPSFGQQPSADGFGGSGGGSGNYGVVPPNYGAGGAGKQHQGVVPAPPPPNTSGGPSKNGGGYRPPGRQPNNGGMFPGNQHHPPSSYPGTSGQPGSNHNNNQGGMQGFNPSGGSPSFGQMPSSGGMGFGQHQHQPSSFGGPTGGTQQFGNQQSGFDQMNFNGQSNPCGYSGQLSGCGGGSSPNYGGDYQQNYGAGNQGDMCQILRQQYSSYPQWMQTQLPSFCT